MSNHDQPIAAKCVGPPIAAAGPNQRWVRHTTALLIDGSAKLYLAAMTDLHSPFVVRSPP